jgi:hypothetical protein
MSPSFPPTTDAETIQRQMREVRAELREDVQELVVSARDMADWTNYVKAYPWLCVGGALALGFLIVPQRSVVIKPDAEGMIELAKRHKLVVKMEDQPKSKKRASLMGQLLGMAASMVLQRGAAVMTDQMSQMFQREGVARHNGHHGATT